MKEKLSQVLLKSAEERNEMDSLKKDLKIANKVFIIIYFKMILLFFNMWVARKNAYLFINYF